VFFAGFYKTVEYLTCTLLITFKSLFLTRHGQHKSLLLHLGSIQLKIYASDPNDKLSRSYIPSIDMVPVVFKTAEGTATVLMASNCSMADIQRRFAKEICRRSRLSQAPKRDRVSKAETAAAAAEIASEIVIRCDGRVLREGTLADACPSAGVTTIEVSLPIAGGMFNRSPFCIRRANGDDAEERAVKAARRDVEGGVRRGRSIDRAGIDRIVRDVAQRAAHSSEAWREKANGGTTVTSHSLRSAFMNRVDPDDTTSAEIFPGEAPSHPNDRYPVCSRDACSLSTCCRDSSGEACFLSPGCRDPLNSLSTQHSVFISQVPGALLRG
jgi:hypothetical protein